MLELAGQIQVTSLKSGSRGGLKIRLQAEISLHTVTGGAGNVKP